MELNLSAHAKWHFLGDGKPERVEAIVYQRHVNLYSLLVVTIL